MKVARKRKLQQTPIRPSTTRAPEGQLTRRVLEDWGSSSFLRPKPHPNQPGWAGGFKKRVPTTLQQGRTIENYAVDAQQRLTASSGARAWYSFYPRLGPISELISNPESTKPLKKKDFILTCEMPTQSLPLFHLRNSKILNAEKVL